MGVLFFDRLTNISEAGVAFAFDFCIKSSESCFRAKLEEREFSKDLQLSGVLEYRNGTFDIYNNGNRALEVLIERKYF